VLPASLVDKTTVKYLKDPTGMVHRVWILSPEEVAQIPKPKPPVKKDEKKDEEKAKD
jgi:hypothetical protein